MRKINLPLTLEIIESLSANDRVLITGKIYTSRDAAHKKLVEMFEKGEKLPIDLHSQTIYYVGACPAKHGQVIGSCGPTTAMRVDDYTPTLLENGLFGMIGKGERGKKVIESMIKNKCVYFSAIGGAGAIYASKVTSCKLIAFEELLAEALYELEVTDFPAIVGIDSNGNSIY